MDVIEPLTNNRILLGFWYRSMRHCVVGFETVQMYLIFFFLLNSITARNNTHEMVAILLQRLGLDPNLILGFSGSRVNRAQPTPLLPYQMVLFIFLAQGLTFFLIEIYECL